MSEMQSTNRDNKLPSLCGEGECTGCGACQQACPVSAIEMVADKKGFLYPNVKTDICIGCKKCEKSCPIKRPEDRRNNNEPYSVIACWLKDENIRRQSSSGGAMSAIASYTLSKGGTVWGAAWDNSIHLTCQQANNSDELDKLRRSKYVQSEMGDAYKVIKSQLEANRHVLFVGTPCQVRGLYAYLGKTDYSNLITADLICHGVPTPKAFQMYIEWLEKKYGDRIVDFNFRDKRLGVQNYSLQSIAYFERLGEKVLTKDDNSFLFGMLRSIYLRPCCHKCVSNGIKRDSDFTIADFWGLGRHESFKHEDEKGKGISLVATNSKKADELFWGSIAPTMHTEKRSLDEAANGQTNYCKSSPKSPLADSFWNSFEKAATWGELMVFLRPSWKERLKQTIKRTLGANTINRLRKLLGR